MSEYSTVAIDSEQTGRRIAQECQRQGLTVRELQSVFGFAAPNAIYRWLNGKALPSLDHFVILASALHVPVDDLIVVKGSVGQN